MKSFRSVLTFLMVGLLLIANSTVAFAAVEAWTTDPATGCKIGMVFSDDTLKLVSAKWSGPMVGGLAEGQGNLQFIYKDKSGTETKAQADAKMKAGKLDGHVNIKWSDGDSFDGNYKEGFREGRGVFKIAGGGVYDGEWKDDKYDGKGTLRMSDGNSYDGDWKDGKLEGQGTYKWASGQVYTGTYKNDQRNGYGVQKDANGKVIFEGEWKDDKPLAASIKSAESCVADARTGTKLCWASDTSTLTAASWSGPSVDGKAEGKGTVELTLRYQDGKTSQGQGEAEMRAGLLDGRVALKWSDGRSYDVNFKRGAFAAEGNGIFRSSDGDTYGGDWKDGRFEGQGTYRWANGEVYTGTFKNGLRNGYGVKTDANGKVTYEGEWKDDKPLAAQLTPLKADKILGIPWGATEDEARRIMLQRPKTSYFSSNKNATTKWQVYVGPYNDVTAKIDVGFYQEKMYQVAVHLYADEDKIMDLFNFAKSGLTERYGAPFEEKGKYLDSKVLWDLGDGYQAGLVVGKNSIPQLPASWGPSQLPWRFPFEVTVYYGQLSTSEKTNKVTGKDF